MSLQQRRPAHKVGLPNLVVALSLAVLIFSAMMQAQEAKEWVSCANFLLPLRADDAQQVGPKECWARETPFKIQGKSFRRIDVGINGSVQGFAVKEGTRARYFIDRPEYAFHQWGQTKWGKGTAHYYASGGVGLTFLLPDAEWNGKLYLHVHGAGTCARDGGGDRRDRPDDPIWDISRFNEMMLAKGYAVAATGPVTTGTVRMDTIPSGTGACTRVELLDGAMKQNLNLTDHAMFHVDLVRLARNVVRIRLGRQPSRTYWYGHSSGARVNRLINFIPELNTDENGKVLVDGFIGDDPAVGEWLPVRFENDKDVLFANDDQKKRFVKHIDISHQLFDEVRFDPGPSWVSNLAIVNKRKSTQHFRAKGMDDRYRMYEIRGISHSSGDSKANPRAGDVQMPNFLPVMDALIDRLDAWVEKGEEPPVTKSDWPPLGDANGDGVLEHPAVALPEVACPLGVYHAYPASGGPNGSGSTGAAMFDGKGIEPVDGRGIFVDMNQNGYHDERENITNAWRRVGLLKPGEEFTREKYVQCVRSAVAALREQGFINEEAGLKHLDDARRIDLSALMGGSN